MIQDERNYGIDSLRIVSMFMIVMLHVLGAGGILSHTVYGTSRYYVFWGIENLILCAVNCYALISGYVGVYSKFKPKNIVMLWLQVEFFSLGIALILYFMFPGVFGLRDIVKSALPVICERYWYFTAYFAMFFFMPFMNRFVCSTPKESLKKFFIAVFVLLSVLPTMADKDVFYTMNGYSALWLMVMYILGAYIRHYGVLQQKRVCFYLGVFGLAIACNWIAKFGLAAISVRILGNESVHTNILLEYTAPTIIVASVMLLCLFSRLKLNRFWLFLVKFLSPLTFGVYLVHMQPMIWAFLGDSPLAWLVELPLHAMIVRFALLVVLIYLVSSMLEWLRRLLFGLLRIDKLVGKLIDKIALTNDK